MQRLKRLVEDSEKCVIMDLGAPVRGVYTDDENRTIDIPRYGVWKKNAAGVSEVIDTGNDLDDLKSKYNTTIVIDHRGKVISQ
jgi:hypothetical protein